MSDLWRYAHASVTGTSHHRVGAPCQDAAACEVIPAAEGPVLVATVADGAGSAVRGGDGAHLACTLFLDELGVHLDGGGSVTELSHEFISAWLQRLQVEVQARADAQGLTPRAYACTFLAGVIGPESATFCQIGDGAIVYSRRGEPDRFFCMFWPQKGEYENQTFFATDLTASSYLDHVTVEWRIDEVALFSDGIQRLALRFDTQTAHQPFFSPMFAPVRQADAGHRSELSHALALYLDSAAINERTDDDKTLLLATRRRDPEGAPTEERGDVDPPGGPETGLTDRALESDDRT